MYEYTRKLVDKLERAQPISRSPEVARLMRWLILGGVAAGVGVMGASYPYSREGLVLLLVGYIGISAGFCLAAEHLGRWPLLASAYVSAGSAAVVMYWSLVLRGPRPGAAVVFAVFAGVAAFLGLLGYAYATKPSNSPVQPTPAAPADRQR